MNTKDLKNKSVRNYVYSGAIQGVIAWTIYAIVECFFLTSLSWMILPSYEFNPIHGGFTAILFLVYPLMGLMQGVFCGLCIPVVVSRIPYMRRQQRTEQMIETAVIFTILLAFTTNVIGHWYFVTMLYIPLFLVILLITILLLVYTFSGYWTDRLKFVANPFIVCIILLGTPMLPNKIMGYESIIIKLCFTLLFFTLILFATFVIITIGKKICRKNTAIIGLPFSIISKLYLMPLGIVFLVVSFFLTQSPLRTIENTKENTKLQLWDLGKPNVLLISFDTVSANHLSLYGYKRDTTPNLRKLAAEAVLYSHAIAPGDMTLVTHASLFTGLYPRRHKAHYDHPNYPDGRPLDTKYQTLAEVLMENGYLTLSVASNYAYLTHEFGMDQGFAHCDYKMPIPIFGKVETYYIRRGIRDVIALFAPRPTFDKLYRNAEEINIEVVMLLDKLKNNNNPFFMFVNYMDAHDPYLPPAPFDVTYPGKNDEFTTKTFHQMTNKVMSLDRKITTGELKHLLSQYDGALSYLDFHVGKLITRLKELDLYENTLIIIMSDHGEVFGERNLIGHAVSVYQDQVHVPLLIKYPNSMQKALVKDTVSIVDIMPTVLDVLDCEVHNELNGQSLLKIKPGAPRDIVSEHYTPGHLLEYGKRFRGEERAIYSGSLKFISSTTGKKELYDLSKDPKEKKNIYKTDRMFSELETKLNQWIKSIKPGPGVGKPSKLNEKTRNRLKALGYIQ